MLKILLFYIIILFSFGLFSCSNTNTLSPIKKSRWDGKSALLQGQQITWTEQEIDSLVLPLSMYNKPQDTIQQFINKNISTWNIIVTVPDSTIKQFRTERDLYQIAARDTLYSANNQIWKTVIYGNSYSAYDKNSNLMYSTTFNNTDTADISSIPLMISSSTILNDSTVQSLKQGLSNNGYTVTQNGDSIYASITIIENGIIWLQTSIFEKYYFSLVNTTFFRNGVLWSTENYTYSIVTNYRIATTIISTSYNTMDDDGKTALNNFHGYVPQEYQTNTSVHIINLTNIQIP